MGLNIGLVVFFFAGDPPGWQGSGGRFGFWFWFGFRLVPPLGFGLGLARLWSLATRRAGCPPGTGAPPAPLAIGRAACIRPPAHSGARKQTLNEALSFIVPFLHSSAGGFTRAWELQGVFSNRGFFHTLLRGGAAAM